MDSSQPAWHGVDQHDRQVGETARHGPIRAAHMDHEVTVALAGQPNVGKTTVFNILTGLTQHVGNWPGKTVEQKTGTCTYGGRQIRVVDLPGTYGLTANSEEERIARDFLLTERPDVVVAVVNAAALERTLYLVAELLALPGLLVVCLNMMDVAEQQGMRIEPHVLEAALGAPVVPLVATKNQGVAELMDAVLRLLDNPAGYAPSRPTIRQEHRPVLEEIRRLIAGHVPDPYPEAWVALKLLEGDVEISEKLRQTASEAWPAVHALLLQHEDAYLDIVRERWDWIGRMVRAAVVRPKAGAISLTDRIDRVATHSLWGLVLLLGILGVAFGLTYGLAAPLVRWLNIGVSLLAEFASQALAGAPAWMRGLLVEGAIGGVGAVLTFLPILVVFFAVLAFLEDTGYMARAAYITDRFMHTMGLHGRSFIPLCLGFGCNVPAVMGARIIEDRSARLLTILLAPFVPCSGRLAVIAFLAPAFFGSKALPVTLGLVSLNLALLALTGVVVNRLVFRGIQTAFIMEMPLYHLPNIKSMGLYVWQNTTAFVKKAGSIILVVSVLTWVLATLPHGRVEDSVLSDVGRWLAPAGRLMGLGDWRLLVALASSFVAKENTVAVLGVLYPATDPAIGLAARVAGSLTPAATLAFLVVLMLFIPCAATVAVIKQETGSVRWPAASVALLLAISLGAGVATYQVARLFT